MILFVVMTPMRDYQKLTFTGPKQLLESLSGDKCLLAHFTELSWEQIQELQPRAILYSGGTVPHAENHGVLENQELQRIMGEWTGAQLAICYSAQLRVLYDGGTIAPIGPLQAGEPDLNPLYRPGMRKELGVYPVEITRQHELFAGLDQTIMVSQEHALEIKNLPAGYTTLARSSLCQVQAYQVGDSAFYGVQFHPEKHRIVETYGDGAQVLRNFFTLARRHAP